MNQMTITDMFRPQKIEPMQLVHFINSRGIGQYKEIQNVIEDICERNNYDMPGESIGRITNSVSVWLLGIGEEYAKYIEDLQK